MKKAKAYVKDLEELLKHRVHEKDHHQHHHMHLFHLPGHHHKDHHQQHQQSAVTGERYREVSSAIDDPSNQSSNATATNHKLTVCRIVCDEMR